MTDRERDSGINVYIDVYNRKLHIKGSLTCSAHTLSFSSNGTPGVMIGVKQDVKKPRLPFRYG